VGAIVLPCALRRGCQPALMAYSIDEAGERHFLKPISFFKPIK
jgi:hypothetical protein